jgi:Flp pilus assembly protein TadD
MSLFLLLVAVSSIAVACGGGSAPEPTTSPAQLDFGVEMARRGLWSEALFRFRQAEQLNPGDPKILNNIAVSYEALGQFERALDYYQKAVEADPTNRDSRRNYSRFVEFYRAFRPDDQRDASLEDESGP